VKYRLKNPGRYRADFQRNCFVAVPEALPAELVSRWRHQARHMMRYARTVTRREQGFELAYRVITGDDIRAHWRELFDCYKSGELLEWIGAVTGDNQVRVSQEIQSAVNLNILDTTASLYRWHFDAVPYTAILYLTDVRPRDGGALRLIANCEPHVPPDPAASKITEIFPRTGTMLVMDGTRCYHNVAPMLRAAVRLSVPLVFPGKQATARPPGLDSYLYNRAV
jgi:hypothetical protein